MSAQLELPLFTEPAPVRQRQSLLGLLVPDGTYGNGRLPYVRPFDPTNAETARPCRCERPIVGRDLNDEAWCIACGHAPSVERGPA
jgi:hypothetical protein